MTKQQFLENCINDGFMLLAASRMKYTPRDAMIGDTKKAWVLVLINECNWNLNQDHKRVMTTFAHIVKHEHEFPTIARFLELLPPRIVVPPKLIARQDITPAQRSKNLETVRETLKMLRSSQMPPRGNLKNGETALQTTINQNQSINKR